MDHKRIIPSTDYEYFHPGHVINSSKKNDWSNVLLTCYSSPKRTTSDLRPATYDHILAFGESGAVKGEHRLNGSCWRSFTWNAKEWFIGPAYQNSRMARWETTCDETIDLLVCYIHLSSVVLEKHALQAADRAPSFIELQSCIGNADPLMYQLGLSLRCEALKQTLYEQIFVEKP